MKPDGAVSAMIGGVDYQDSVFNRAIQAHRQPGSAFKPFVYLAALESGITPWDTRDDVAVDINGYKPANFGGKSYGTLTLGRCAGHIRSTPSPSIWRRKWACPKWSPQPSGVGITSPLQANASLALGTSEVTPLELTAAYAAFANGGYRVYPYFVTEVDIGSRPLYRAPRAAAATRDRLQRGPRPAGNAVGRGGRRHRRLCLAARREAAGKTGTTQDSHDAWFVGFTTDYVAGCLGGQ